MQTLRVYEGSKLDDVRKESGVTLQDLRNSVMRFRRSSGQQELYPLWSATCYAKFL